MKPQPSKSKRASPRYRNKQNNSSVNGLQENPSTSYIPSSTVTPTYDGHHYKQLYEAQVKEAQYQRDLKIAAWNQVFNTTTEELELMAKIEELEFDNKKKELECLDLLNRLDEIKNLAAGILEVGQIHNTDCGVRANVTWGLGPSDNNQESW